MCSIEQGTCDICHTPNVPITRHYQYWKTIKCDCCSPQHFDIIRHCKDCKPIELQTTRYTSKGHDYQFFPEFDTHLKLPK